MVNRAPKKPAGRPAAAVRKSRPGGTARAAAPPTRGRTTRPATPRAKRAKATEPVAGKPARAKARGRKRTPTPRVTEPVVVPTVAAAAEAITLHAEATSTRGMLDIWFFVGLVLVAYGGILGLAGLYYAFAPYAHTVLSELNPSLWWGVLMLAGGIGMLSLSRRIRQRELQAA